MKIALFGPAYPFRGGIAQFNGVLSRALVEAGHDVRLINFRKQFPRLLFPGKTQYDETPQALRVESERVFTLWNPLTWRRTAAAIEHANPDLIVVQWWMPFFAIGYWAVMKALKPRFCKRVIFILHNVVPHERRPGDRFLSRLALSTANGYVVLSRGEEGELFKLFPTLTHKRVRFSPHPLYDCYRMYGKSRAEAQAEIGVQSERLLLFFGFIRHYKGLDTLLRAMPRVLARDPNIRLVVVGEFYESRKTYDDLIAALELRDSVIVKEGYISGDEVGKYFAASDCVVLPYRNATQSGIVQIAYALHTPVITTHVGGLGEVVANGVTGFTVPPEDSEELANAILQFYDAGGRPALEPNVIEESKKYSWSSMIDTIISLRKPA